MHLKYLIPILTEPISEKTKVIFAEARSAGIRVCESQSTEMLCFDREYIKNGIVLTDSQEIAAGWKASGGVCVGYEQADNVADAFFTGADTVISSLEELDLHLLEETFCHARHLPLVIGRTRRLVLRELCREDLPFLLGIAREKGNDFLLSEGNESFFEEKFLLGYMEKYYPLMGFGIWLVSKEEKPVGLCGFGEFEFKGKVYPQLAYYIKEEFRKNGYAKEMNQLALSYLKEYLGYEKVYLTCKNENLPSMALAQKMGFEIIEKNEKQCVLVKLLKE